MVARFEKFSLLISELSRFWHKLATDVMEVYGLKGPYAVYFTTLYHYEEGLTAVKLSEMCSRDKSDVSRAISLLEKRGLAEKISNNNNYYRAKIVLTEEGRKIAQEINIKTQIAVNNGGHGLDEEQRENFYNALQLISDNLRELSAKGLK